EHAELQVEYRLTGDSETEVAWFDDAGVNRSDRDLKDAFAEGRPIDVPFTREGRKHAIDWKVFPHWMNVGPVIVQRNTSRVGMAFEMDAEPILDFALLPVQRRQLGGERGKHGLVWIDSRTEDEILRIAGEFQNVVIQEAAFSRAPIFGKDGSDSRFLLFAQNRNSRPAVRIPKGQVNLVIVRG